MTSLRMSFLVVLLLAGILGLFSQPTRAAEITPPNPFSSRPAPDAVNPEVSYFPETGHYLGYGFREYWQKNGGLAQFGYPLTEEFSERNPADGKTYTVQYLERARFEYHPEFKTTPYEVELGLLGLQTLAGRQFEQTGPFNSTPQSYYFPETRHSLSLGFKTYWDTHGGLPIYGFPVSEEITEGGFTVQYFERARFEYHPENRGTPFEILLGLLGRAALQNQAANLSQVFNVNLDTSRVVQGHTLSVIINGPLLDKVRSNLEGQNIPLAPLPNSRLGALIPIASNANPRTIQLQTEITDNSGVTRRFNQNFTVVPGQFEQQTVQLDPAVEAGLGSEEEQTLERNKDFRIFGQYSSQKLWMGRFNWPVKGIITTSFGSRRNYVGGGQEIHDGIDIAVPEGTPILAPAGGIVVLAEFQKVRGNIVIIDHGLGLHSAYFHQSRLRVKVGDIVEPGEVIGLAGTTGLSTGTHLHWEMRLGAIGIDPTEWVNRPFFN